MTSLNKKLQQLVLMLLPALFFLASCNKPLEQFSDIPLPVYPSGAGMAATIAATPTDSLYSRLIIKSGLAPKLNNTALSYTMFVPDNNGMKIFINAASGGAIPLASPDSNFSKFITNSLPAATCAAIVLYNTVGQKFPWSSISTAFPNYPLPSEIILDPTQPFVRLPIFPLRGATYSYVNNIPVIAVDQPAANGVIHHTYTVVAPPSKVLDSFIINDPTLTYFRAAILRADSGQTGLNRFDSLLSYPVTNMTVLAPNNAAMQPVVTGFIYQGLLANLVQPATAADTANALATASFVGSSPAALNYLPVASVRGILAYHLLASKTTGSYKPDIRAFSVNFPATPTFVTTLVNTSFAAHPGISAKATYIGPAVTSLQFTGLGTFPPGGLPFSSTPANAVSMDKHGVNGVLHIIDRVLLPQ